MILEYIRYRIDESSAAEFEAAYARAADAMHKSEHCIDFELSRAVEKPDNYILRITWDSLDGHLTGFRGSELFRAFFAEVKNYVGAIDEMQHYELTSVTGTGSGADVPPTLFEWAGGAEAFDKLSLVSTNWSRKTNCWRRCSPGWMRTTRNMSPRGWARYSVALPNTPRTAAATRTCSPITSVRRSRPRNAGAGWTYCSTQRTKWACPAIRSSGRPLSPTSSGAPASRWETPSRRHADAPCPGATLGLGYGASLARLNGPVRSNRYR